MVSTSSFAAPPAPASRPLIGPENIDELAPKPKSAAVTHHARKTIGPNDKHACVECGKAYYTNNDLEKHAAKTQHGAFHCKCGEEKATFTKHSSLRRHITESEAPIKYHCPLLKKEWGLDRNCYFGCKRLGHLKDHFLSNAHKLDKKAANELLKEHYPAAQRRGRRKSTGKNQLPPVIHVANAADSVSKPPEANASRNPEQEICDDATEHQEPGSATSSPSVIRGVRSPESGNASTAQQSVTGVASPGSALSHGTPTTVTNIIGFGSGVFGTTVATSAVSIDVDSNMPYPSYISQMSFGNGLGTTVPGDALSVGHASQLDFGNANGFATIVPAQLEHGFTPASTQVPAPIYGFPPTSNHGGYMGQDTMPGFGASIMGTPSTIGTPAQFTPTMFQHQAYPTGVQIPTVHLSPPMMAAPYTNWPQTINTFTPVNAPAGMAPSFGGNMFATDGATFDTTAVANTFAEDDPFSLSLASGFVGNLNTDNQTLDNTDHFSNWNGAGY